jgi:hypothetical protein
MMAELGPSIVSRVVAKAQRYDFDPPDLSSGVGRGLWVRSSCRK